MKCLIVFIFCIIVYIIFLYKIGGVYTVHLYLVPGIGHVPTYRFIFQKNVLVKFKYYKSYPEIKEFTYIQPNIVKKNIRMQFT